MKNITSVPLLCQRLQFGVITASGDRLDDYLQGQITQDMTRLSADGLLYSALLTPQGKTVCDLWLTADGERRLLIVPSCALDDACARLRRFCLGYDLAIKSDNSLQLWSLQGEGSHTLAQDIPLSWPMAEAHDEGCWLLSASQPDIAANWVDETVIEAARIAYGTPQFGVDWRDFPLNANLIERGGVSFEKGCFVGQEVTSRMRWRGGIRKAVCRCILRHLPAALPANLCTTTTIGTITSAAMGRDSICYGIAQLPLETITNANRLTLEEDGSPVEIITIQHP